MGWKLVKVDSTNTKSDEKPNLTNITKKSKAESIAIPSWYTDEDHKAKSVLDGICKGCAHLLLVKDNSSKHEFKGVWCAALKKKLEVKVESCPKFRSFAQELAEIITNMKARGELPKWV